MIDGYPLYWPAGYPRTRSPKRSRFGSYDYDARRNRLTLTVALDEVEEQVRLLLNKRVLGDHDLIISTNMRRRKSDGGIYAKEREPEDSGVAVYFKLSREMRVIACDKWQTVRENLHAAALSIEALRGLERWGASEIVPRAFRGFIALPEPESNDWYHELGVPPDATPDEITAAYRARLKEAHPDAGGSVDELHRVRRAYSASPVGGRGGRP